MVQAKRKRRRITTESSPELGPRGAFDLPDGHYDSLPPTGRGKPGEPYYEWGFDKKGDRIFPPPCIMERVHKIEAEMVGCNDLIAAVNAHIQKIYSQLANRRITLCQEIATRLRVTDALGLEWRLFEGSISLKTDPKKEGKKET